MYAIAIVATADRACFSFLNTLMIIRRLLEYLNIFAALSTLNVRNKRRTLRTRNPLLKKEKDESITSKSIAAIGVNG